MGVLAGVEGTARPSGCVVEAAWFLGLFGVHGPWTLLGVIPAGLHLLLGGEQLPKKGNG